MIELPVPSRPLHRVKLVVSDPTLDTTQLVLDELNNLNLTYCNKITNNGVSHLSNMINLNNLNITHCREITNNGI